MLYRTVASLVLLTAIAVPAHAQKMDAKARCLQGVQDVQNILKEEEDTGRPGKKIEQEANELLPVAQHLCEQGNFLYADRLLLFLRHLLAQ